MKIQINKILKYKYIGIVLIAIFCLLLPRFSFAQCASQDPGSWQGAVVSRGGNEVDRSCKAGSIDRGGPGRHATGVWCENNNQFTKNNNTATYCASCRGSSLETCSRPAPGRILDLHSWQGEVVEKGDNEVDRSCKAGDGKDRGGPGRNTTGVWCAGTQNSVYDGLTFCGGCKGYAEIDDPNRPPTVNYTSTTDISYNIATANWSYSDPDGDVQAYYQVQVATDPGFGNIVFSQAGLGGATNMAVNSLSSNTTYYPRVAVQDAKGAWSSWSSGSSFTTIVPDNLPTIKDIQAVSVGYNNGKITWNYSDVDGDAQTWWNTQISTTDSFNTNDIVIWSGEYGVGNSSDTSIDLNPLNRSKLVPNTIYYTRVLVNNSKANSGWVNGPSFKTEAYPALNIDYKINNINSKSVTVNTGDNVNAVWNITDADGGEVEGLVGKCDISSGGFNDIGKTGLNLVSSNSAKAPISPTDKTYTINLSCAAKPGGVAVNEDIQLTVQSYPIITCIIKKKVVSTESPIAQVEGRIENANPQYRWEVKRYAGDINPPIKVGPIDTNPQNFTLDYTGLGLGKYKPVIRAEGTGGRPAEKECGEISNFGTRSFQEVAK